MNPWALHQGDALETIRSMEEASFDGCLTDPPYGLSFMGKAWDHGVPSAEVWADVLRVLKPGAFLLAFGGTRTFHRLTCAIEDAGFEVRDCVCWLYGSGFPKSMDISKALDKVAGVERRIIATRPARGMGYHGTEAETEAARTWSGYGTALKPAWEPCIVAMKPLNGTFVENALKHGVAGLAIEAVRIPGAVPSVPQPAFKSPTGQVYGFQAGEGRNGEMSNAPAGRWPANLILDPEAAAALNAQAGGVPSRFFYTAKASRRERDVGLGGFKEVRRTDGRAKDIENPRLRTTPRYNHHPCLKPLDLNRYLASLILPPKRETPRRVLVPYAGSGSEMIGALLAGWDQAVGVEREADYCTIAEARLAQHVGCGLEVSLFDRKESA